MQVSESAATSLNLELISYLCKLSNNGNESALEQDDINTSASIRGQMLESQGVLVGLRITERLLTREPLFSGSPTDVCRFIGNNLWKAMFSKRIDSIKMSDNVFHFRDKGHRWLEGFPKADELMTNNGESAAKSDSIGRKDVLKYIIGVLKGSTHLLYNGQPVSIRANCTADGDTHFVLSFNSG
ncbi:hypothetical protein STCU_00197 [Strigomonas culicis]|uniref:Uncharacterized protein n=1 Tax=Strigomonas culicis TaxID=28005 RepID=S9WMD4_9TRYP|nr:hypothetical protein STCU_00945 [Strigomonas culicis]EPY37100.1 hypothetical protein STCU_00197 [Strigomonas culicis]|eukprot:EPY35729.1 hypothetical protein STCU_00945 [Strigomonas culicis]